MIKRTFSYIVRSLLLFCSILFPLTVAAQSFGDTVQTEAKDSLYISREDRNIKPILTDDDTKGATYPGGQVALIQFLSTHIQYPPDAVDNNVQGRVVLKFLVTETGEIDPESIRVVKRVSPSIDSEAIRVIKLMPRWKPGYNKGGLPIETWFLLPIIFSLQ